MPDQRQQQQQHDGNGNGSTTATERSFLLIPKLVPLREVSSTESQVSREVGRGGRKQAGVSLLLLARLELWTLVAVVEVWG